MSFDLATYFFINDKYVCIVQSDTFAAILSRSENILLKLK